jgi:hypothetical protein
MKRVLTLGALLCVVVLAALPKEAEAHSHYYSGYDYHCIVYQGVVAWNQGSCPDATTMDFDVRYALKNQHLMDPATGLPAQVGDIVTVVLEQDGPDQQTCCNVIYRWKAKLISNSGGLGVWEDVPGYPRITMLGSITDWHNLSLCKGGGGGFD